MIRKVTLAILAAIALTAFAPKPGTKYLDDTITGRMSVHDGDTGEIQGYRIRFYAIDAPESSQLCQDTNGKNYRCGQKAAFALADKIGSVDVTCVPQRNKKGVIQTTYDRTVATCFQKGEDLNAWMVHEGQARAYKQYGGKIYQGLEDEARDAKRGIWAGTFQDPWDWRKENKGKKKKAAPEDEDGLEGTEE